MTTLYDLARYYRNKRLVGEDRAGITTIIGLAGGASVVALGYSGTGKTHLADIAAELLPEGSLYTVDTLSKLGIWSKGIVEGITAARFVYFPESQNSSDNEEVVKVKKKWGDGKAIERGKSEDYGESTSITRLEPRIFLSTAAITNEAHERTFDAESARRVIKVSTNPSEDATGAVLDSMADAMVRGRVKTRILSVLQEDAVKKHVARVMTENSTVVDSVRFFGAPEMLAAIPRTFPESRSAFALFEKVLLGVGRWYAASEVVVDGEVFLSPQRVAEAWSFYADTLLENALKWDTSDREILGAFPSPHFNESGVPAPEASLDIQSVMRKLKTFGITDPSMVRRQLARLVTKGFLAEAEGLRTVKWHKTGIVEVANYVSWAKVISACKLRALDHLDGPPLVAYLKKCEEATGPRAIQNPITGKVGPIEGKDSVLYVDAATGTYAPVGVKAQHAQGLARFA